MKIGEKLKTCRANTDYTQADVAEKLHVSRKTISGWETGRNFPDIGSLVQLSDIYMVSLDDLMRDDRMLEHFAEQRQSRIRDKIIIHISYWINVIFLILGYIDLMRPNGFHLALIPFILLINIVVFISHFERWNYFKKINYTLKVVLTFVVVFIGTAIISVTNQEFIRAFSSNGAYFSSGMILSRVMLSLMLSVSTIMVIYFKNTRY